MYSIFFLLLLFFCVLLCVCVGFLSALYFLSFHDLFWVSFVNFGMFLAIISTHIPSALTSFSFASEFQIIVIFTIWYCYPGLKCFSFLHYFFCVCTIWGVSYWSLLNFTNSFLIYVEDIAMSFKISFISVTFSNIFIWFSFIVSMTLLKSPSIRSCYLPFPLEPIGIIFTLDCRSAVSNV